ncbi:MAG: hypothetical protein P4L50_29210 [Anaerolineaceae bacterium]|nr:hypothetical protein [Anaerolineaceae bacterium]
MYVKSFLAMGIVRINFALGNKLKTPSVAIPYFSYKLVIDIDTNLWVLIRTIFLIYLEVLSEEIGWSDFQIILHERDWRSSLLLLITKLPRILVGPLIMTVDAQYEKPRKKRHLSPRSASEFFVAYPKRLSLQYDYSIMVFIYPPNNREKADKSLATNLKNKGESIEKYQTTNQQQLDNNPEQLVKLQFSCPDIEFTPQEKIIQLEVKTFQTSFFAKPKDNCSSGKHRAMLSISDQDSGSELKYIEFKLETVPLFMNRSNRSILSIILSGISFMAAIIMFFLTALQIVTEIMGLTIAISSSLLAIMSFSYFSSFKLMQKAP